MEESFAGGLVQSLGQLLKDLASVIGLLLLDQRLKGSRQGFELRCDVEILLVSLPIGSYPFFCSMNVWHGA